MIPGVNECRNQNNNNGNGTMTVMYHYSDDPVCVHTREKCLGFGTSLFYNSHLARLKTRLFNTVPGPGRLGRRLRQLCSLKTVGEGINDACLVLWLISPPSRSSFPRSCFLVPRILGLLSPSPARLVVWRNNALSVIINVSDRKPSKEIFTCSEYHVLHCLPLDECYV